MAIYEGLWEGITRLQPRTTLALGYPEFKFGEEEDAYKLFEGIGSELICIDHRKFDGREVVANLNWPHDLGQFDLVLDHGTLEHCANIGQALKTAVQSVKVDGHIIHVAPVTMVNHGYWNFCPIFFKDFYHINGFRVLKISGVDLDQQPAQIVYDHKFSEMKRNISAVVIARKFEEREIVWPIQGSYK